MAPAVRTKYEVVRWTAIQTMFALGLVLPATACAVLLFSGGDLDRSVSGRALLIFGLALSAAETLVFAPIVAVRSGRMLRQLNLARDELVRLANVDSLTGLLNRRGFDKVAAGAFGEPDTLGRPAAALMCDLDRFKAINDQFGHGFGDAALRQVADLLRAATQREKVVLGRMGGDEFLVLMTDITPRDAFAVAESVRLTVGALPVQLDGVKAQITMSVGVAATPSFESRVSRLIARADAALYEAKQAGRDRVVVAQDFYLDAADRKAMFETVSGFNLTRTSYH